MKPDPFCCYVFADLVECAGKRGLSVLIRKMQDGIRFHLEMRAILAEHEELLTRTVRKTPGPEFATLRETCGIKYCPFCGVLLRDLVAKCPEEFNRIAEGHSIYLDEYYL